MRVLEGADLAKRCSGCQRSLPKTTEYFHRSRVRYDGFQHQRKECERKRRREYLEANPAHGGLCQCCGEFRPEFLSIDHIEGGGSKDRRNGAGSGAKLYRQLKKLGWPKEKYRLLCMNCNFARGRYLRCPHDDEKGARQSVA